MLGNLLLGSLINGALGARHKPYRRASRFLTGGGPFLNLGTLIGAAGVAWGAYEHFKTRPPASTTTVEGGFDAPAAPPPPLPRTGPPSGPPPLPAASAPEGLDALRRLVALTIAAARCDGSLGEEEYGRILQAARGAGADELVTAELANPRSLAQIVGGASDPKLRSELYVLAYGIVRADSDVTGAERAWLAQLAGLLQLDPATAARLEKETAERIDRIGA